MLRVTVEVCLKESARRAAARSLLLIDGSLIAEGFDQHIPKGYVYGPIAFSAFVEFLNLRMRARRNSKPVELHGTYVKND